MYTKDLADTGIDYLSMSLAIYALNAHFGNLFVFTDSMAGMIYLWSVAAVSTLFVLDPLRTLYRRHHTAQLLARAVNY